jgi:DNA-binding response OmpR family regulator
MQRDRDTNLTKNKQGPLEKEAEQAFKRRILVVDNVKTNGNKHQLCNTLLECGFQIYHFNEPAEVRELLSTPASNMALPDLIICDLFLNGMDGLDFILEIRRIQFENNLSIPILMSAAIESNPTFEEAVLQTGADDFIVKPIRSSDLLLRVRRLLRGMPGITRERLESLRLEVQRGKQFEKESSSENLSPYRGLKSLPGLVP